MERIRIIHGDITRLEMDAIINSANKELASDTDIDKTILQIAGPELLKECQTLGGCLVGEVKMTKGYRLAARNVIHTVAPVWQGGDQGEAEQLASCYTKSLQLVKENGFRNVAFPALGCGSKLFPVALAAEIAMNTVLNFLQQDTSIQRFVFVCSEEEHKRVFDSELTKRKPESTQWWKS